MCESLLCSGFYVIYQIETYVCDALYGMCMFLLAYMYTLIYIHKCVSICSYSPFKEAALDVQARGVMWVHIWLWHVLMCTHVYFLGLGSLTGIYGYMPACQGMSGSFDLDIIRMHQTCIDASVCVHAESNAYMSETVSMVAE